MRLVWSWLAPARGFLMNSSFPASTGPTPFARERESFARVMEIVGVVRNLRNELGVQPGKRGTAILRAPDAALAADLGRCGDLIALLAKMETVEMGE